MGRLFNVTTSIPQPDGGSHTHSETFGIDYVVEELDGFVAIAPVGSTLTVIVVDRPGKVLNVSNTTGLQIGDHGTQSNNSTETRVHQHVVAGRDAYVSAGVDQGMHIRRSR